MNVKNFLVLGVSLFLPFAALEVYAQDGGSSPIVFQPLEGTGIQGLTDVETGNSLPALLNAGYQLLIGIASVLAVVMIFYAGFRYATTTSGGAKTDAKNRILAALGGLLLALSSWLILTTIDADLVGVELAFQGFEEGKLVFPVLTEDERQSIYNEYGATITVSEDGHQSVTSVGDLLNAGRGDVSGIPTKGDYNPTIKAVISSSNGQETQMTKETFRGDTWVTARTSWFAGPHDTTGVGDKETGALSSCSGRLRALPNTFQGVALRWNYSLTPKSSLPSKKLVIFSPDTNKTAYVTPCDWGPHTQKTDKSVDLTPGACIALGLVPGPNPSRSQLGNCHGKKVYFRFAS